MWIECKVLRCNCDCLGGDSRKLPTVAIDNTGSQYVQRISNRRTEPVRFHLMPEYGAQSNLAHPKSYPSPSLIAPRSMHFSFSGISFAGPGPWGTGPALHDSIGLVPGRVGDWWVLESNSCDSDAEDEDEAGGCMGAAARRVMLAHSISMYLY